MPHHTDDCDNVGSQAGHVAPDSQSRSSCTGRDTSRFESVDSDKEKNLVVCASDEAYDQEHSKYVWTNCYLARCHESEC